MNHVAIIEDIYGPIPPFEEMPAPPTHCTNCGRVLIRRDERQGYLPDGRPAIMPTVRCPVTVGWWNRGSLRFLGHEEYEPDHFIKWYWRRREYR